MKKIILILTLFVSVSTIGYAQTDMESIATKAANGEMEISDALIGLGKGINPKAFNANWSKISASWYKNAEKVSDVSGASKSLTTLVSNLTAESFTPDFFKSKEDWGKKLSLSQTLPETGNLIKILIDGLNPGSLTKEFIEVKEAYLKGLDVLK